MQINKVNNKTSFSGIYIKNASFEEVRDVAMFLKINGYYPLGYKKYYLPNSSRYNIISKAREVRTIGMYGIPKEFGTLYFPWSRSACLVAPHKTEVSIAKLVKKIRPDAIFDMLA